MDEIAELAGLTKRTVYNNYGGKEALFTAIVAEVVGYAEWFTQGLRAEFTSRGTRATLPAFLAQVGSAWRWRSCGPRWWRCADC